MKYRGLGFIRKVYQTFEIIEIVSDSSVLIVPLYRHGFYRKMGDLYVGNRNYEIEKRSLLQYSLNIFSLK